MRGWVRVGVGVGLPSPLTLLSPPPLLPQSPPPPPPSFSDSLLCSTAPKPPLNPPAPPRLPPAPPPPAAAVPGPDPGKLAKRRHQISSLYHYAKQRELEQLEVRGGGGVKTKAETHRKYGW